MARRQDTTMATANTTGAAITATADPGAELGPAESITRHEEIAQLAYSYWQARGCPLGSSQEDWFRAESELREQAVGQSV